MHRLIIPGLAVFFAGCAAAVGEEPTFNCDCPELEPLPEGDFAITGSDPALPGDGVVTLAGDAIVVRYSDADGNVWEAEYARMPE